ncbi:WXG100 family type VII secretion target [Nocardia sp. NPDC059240]|uniref:WXG100 family type VII secretion target n=1 Tax=Nocardia sp. NPDC059240 TaxID=3346786 RepID=UPI00367B4936
MLRWKLQALSDIATDCGTIVTAIDASAESMNRTLHGLDWSGPAANAATDRADRERTQVRALAGAYDRLGTACKQAFDSMDHVAAEIRTAVGLLHQDGFTVGEDFTVKHADAGRAERAANETARLQGLATTLGADDDKFAAAMSTAIEDLRAFAPESAVAAIVAGHLDTSPFAELTPDRARKDLADWRDGTASPAALARIRLATDLADEDRTDLAGGKTAALPQYGYLGGLMDGMRDMGVQDIAGIGAKLSGGQRDAVTGGIADALRIISDPNVHAATVDGAPIDGTRGGMAALPPSVQSLLTDKLVREGPWGGAYFGRSADMEALTRLLGKGDQGVAQGSDLNRGLIKQASEIAGATKDPRLTTTRQDGTGLDSDTMTIRSAGDMVSNILTVAKSDHIAVHDALTGQNMDVTVKSGHHYDPTDHIGSLLDRYYVGHDKGVVSFIEEAGQDAASTNRFQQVQAGESAHALAQYLGDNEDKLFDLTGSQGPLGDFPKGSLGEANPEIARALSRTIGNYIPNMVGFDGGLDTGGFDPLSSRQARNVFAVIDTDHAAAEYFNKAAYSAVGQLDYEFGMSGCKEIKLGEFASRIDWAAQYGMSDSLGGNFDKSGLKEGTGAYFDALKPIVKAGIEEIPGAKFTKLLTQGLDAGWTGSKMQLQRQLVEMALPGGSGGADPHTSGANQYWNILKGLADGPERATVLNDPNLREYLNADGTVRSFDLIGGSKPVMNLPGFKQNMLNNPVLRPGLQGFDDLWQQGASAARSDW